MPLTYFSLLQALVRALCKLEPQNRLGYQRGGVGDIRKQRWFQGFDWKGLQNQMMDSPFDPEVRSPFDARHFCGEVEEIDESEKDDMTYLASERFNWDETF